MNKKNILLLSVAIIFSSNCFADVESNEKPESGFESAEGKTKIEKLTNYANHKFSFCQFMNNTQVEINRLNAKLSKESKGDKVCISDATTEIRRAYKMVNQDLKKNPSLSKQLKAYTTVAIASFESLEIRLTDNLKIYDQRTANQGDELKKAGISLLLDAE